MNINALKQTYAPTLEDREFRLILQQVLGLSTSDLIIAPELVFSGQEQQLVEMIVQRRQNGEPLAHIFGEWEFWSLPFYLSKHTLVPRPDTETIIDAALKRFKSSPPETILDLGTGSGCILIALLHEFESAFGIGIDLSAGAVKTARRNAIRNNVHRRAHFMRASWFDGVRGTFDLIVSNPPYIKSADIAALMPEVKDFDPMLALDGGTDGFDQIRILLRDLQRYLSPRGAAMIEIGYDQADEMINLVENSGLCVIDVHRDLNGHQRIVECALRHSHGDKSKISRESLD